MIGGHNTKLVTTVDIRTFPYILIFFLGNIQELCKATILARDLVNERADIANPKMLHDVAEEIAANTGMTVCFPLQISQKDRVYASLKLPLSTSKMKLCLLFLLSFFIYLIFFILCMTDM